MCAREQVVNHIFDDNVVQVLSRKNLPAALVGHARRTDSRYDQLADGSSGVKKMMKKK